MRIKPNLPVILVLALMTGCSEKNSGENWSVKNAGDIVDRMADVMIHDVTNPPLASRFYAYAFLAGNEVIAQSDTAAHSMAEALKNFPSIPKPRGSKQGSTHLSALLAILETAKQLQPSGGMLQEFEDKLLDSCRKEGFEDDLINHSLAYAKEISELIIKYAKADRYDRISNYQRYAPSREPGTWYPTPPGFFAPVEPYFNTIRSFTLDSAAQFKPKPPTLFDPRKNSEFYKLTEEVRDAKGDKQGGELAAFWDCNPFALQSNGHLMVGVKLISPGAHWMGIANLACQKANVSLGKAIHVNAVVAVGLMDAFLSCWDEKYRSNRIRPETAVRALIDPNWTPFLQSPPFPEYPSGHSVISSASAVILSHFFGDDFGYTDTVENRFGLEPRKFTSFRAAAKEAAISRLYGGIHYRDAIEIGEKQGEKIGEWVWSKIAVKP